MILIFFHKKKKYMENHVKGEVESDSSFLEAIALEQRLQQLVVCALRDKDTVKEGGIYAYIATWAAREDWNAQQMRATIRPPSASSRIGSRLPKTTSPMAKPADKAAADKAAADKELAKPAGSQQKGLCLLSSRQWTVPRRTFSLSPWSIKPWIWQPPNVATDSYRSPDFRAGALAKTDVPR